MSQYVFFLYSQAWGRASGPVWWGYGTYPRSLLLMPGTIGILAHPESAGTVGSAAAPEDQNISHEIRSDWKRRTKCVKARRNTPAQPFPLNVNPLPFSLKANAFFSWHNSALYPLHTMPLKGYVTGLLVKLWYSMYWPWAAGPIALYSSSPPGSHGCVSETPNSRPAEK